MPAPQVTATPQPRAVPARRTANVSFPTIVRVIHPRAESAAVISSLLRGVVDACEQEDAGLGERLAHRDARAVHGIVQESGENGQAPLDAEVVWRTLRPAHERDQGAVDAQQREVRLRVPAVDGEDEPVAHRLAPRREAKR